MNGTVWDLVIIVSVDRSELSYLVSLLQKTTISKMLKLSYDESNILHPFLSLMTLISQFRGRSDRVADLCAVACITVCGLTPHSGGFLLGLHGSTVPGLSPTTSPITALWRQPGTPVMHTDKRMGMILIVIVIIMQ